jgi:cytolysin-activating lysine-acyltransferase
MNQKSEDSRQEQKKPDKTATGQPGKQGMDHSKTLSTVLGEIIWLMTRSTAHRYFFISDLEWMVLQPVSLGQFRVFHGDEFPVGVLFWAYVNGAVEDRLKEGITRLSPGDWKSGDRLWLVDAITPFGNVQTMLDDLAKNVFPDTPFQYLQRDDDGELVVKTSAEIEP